MSSQRAARGRLEALPGGGAAGASADGDERAAGAVRPRRALPGRLVFVLWGVTGAIWLLVDQATKVIAEARLETGVTGAEIGPVGIRLVYNPGGAFGLPGFPGMFVVVTVLVLVLLLRAVPRADRLGLAAAYGLVTGGALGNLVDRLFRDPGFPMGEVVDFIDLGWWPVFNIADVGIVLGALLIALLLARSEQEERAAERARAGRESVRPETTQLGGVVDTATPSGDGDWLQSAQELHARLLHRDRR